jgi:hypothetical protein
MSDPVKLPRHLMDPSAPRRPQPAAGMSLSHVQRWVMSTLAVTTILHLSAGLVIAALFLDRPGDTGRIGLNVIAAAFGVIAVACGLLIHQRSVLSPWLVLGVVPGVIGLWLTLR